MNAPLSLDELLHEALQLEAGPTRDRWIENACGGDLIVERELRLLIAAHESAGTFLSEPLHDTVSLLEPLWKSEGPPPTEGTQRRLELLGDLATLYWSTGRYDEAEPLLVDALRLLQRTRGDHHPDTLETMLKLAVLYRYTGRLDRAEPL